MPKPTRATKAKPGERPPVSRLKKALNYVTGQITTLGHRRNRLQHRIAHRKDGPRAKSSIPTRYIQLWTDSFKYRLPYIWGGAHVTPAPAPAVLAGRSSGYDCSSGACHFDQAMGVDTPTGTTFSMAEPQAGLVKGPGRFITHFIKNVPASDAHVVTRVTDGNGKVLGWFEVGGSDNTRGGGPCQFNPSPSRIAQFPLQVHPKGY